MSLQRGRFITLEGVEGVGKTSNLSVIKHTLESAGIDVLVTREPGGTEVGEALRQLVLSDKYSLTARAELLIMVASRLELIAQRIQPALDSGQWVLCDRFMDASVAYQGAGRELGTDRVVDLHRLMGIVLKPDLTVLLDLSVEQGLARMKARAQPDRIERENLAFFERVRQAYLDRASEEPDRFCLIDASEPLALVSENVHLAVQQFIETVRKTT